MSGLTHFSSKCQKIHFWFEKKISAFLIFYNYLILLKTSDIDIRVILIIKLLMEIYILLAALFLSFCQPASLIQNVVELYLFSSSQVLNADFLHCQRNLGLFRHKKCHGQY